MNDQLEKVIAACLDDLSRCKPAQTESILRQHFAPVVAAVERDRADWIRAEGERTDQCTYSILGDMRGRRRNMPPNGATRGL